MTGMLDEARAAFAAQSWKRAEDLYRAAAEAGPLPGEDLDRLATALHLLGREPESRETLATGYRRSLEDGDRLAAARFAFWIGHGLIFSGDEIQSNAWFARAREAIPQADTDCPERAMLLFAEAIRFLMSGHPEPAAEGFARVLAAGRECARDDITTLGSHGLGRALIAQGRVDEGMAILDEVMVSASEGRVPPMVLGDLYCGVLEACHDVLDVRRAREWTAALTRWCESQPDLVPYRGPCLVHRVEVLRLSGEWQEAFAEARKACEWLSAPVSPEGPGDAFYQLGELHRLRGEYSEAEEAYRQASRFGRPPEPGIALLWFARGQRDAARTALARALDEAPADLPRRAELLSTYIEVLLAGGETAAAREAARDLASFAARFGAAALKAMSEAAHGRVLIAEGSPAESLGPLRRAWVAWQKLDAPFEGARVRVQIGIACRALGDLESAAMEFDAARWVFQELSAIPELATLDALESPLGAVPAAGGLTPREVDVLRLVADGHTNKEIAVALVISEHTVARHVQNMLAKLGFASRARLAAYAIEQGLYDGR